MFRLVRALVALLSVAALAQDKTPSDIGISGGSIPADGVIPAVELLPAYVEAAGIYGLGRAATTADIAVWNIDVRYDGEGLPPGKGDVESGGSVYDQKCASCHGDFGQGEGRWPVLSGGFDSLQNQGGNHRPEKTIGSYWPYAPSLYDYIRRTMPYTAPQSLTDNETYALVAYLLFLNSLVEEDFVATKESLAGFVMPNRDNFYIDPRPDVHATACMRDCLDGKTLGLVEAIKGVTPVEHLQRDDSATATSDKATTSRPAASQYKQFCAVCHDSGVAGAPKVGDAVAWKTRLGNGGRDALLRSVITGKGAMPPKGGAVHLSDDAIAEIVNFMIGE